MTRPTRWDLALAAGLLGALVLVAASFLPAPATPAAPEVGDLLSVPRPEGGVCYPDKIHGGSEAVGMGPHCGCCCPGATPNGCPPPTTSQEGCR